MPVSVNTKIARGVQNIYSAYPVGDNEGNQGFALDPSPPSLALDFSQPLPSSVTFSRASSGTYFGSDGLLKTAANNEARIDYDPAFAVRYGPELVTNGDFSNGTTGWVIQQPTSGSVGLSNGGMRINSVDGTNANIFAVPNPLAIGEQYICTFDVVSYTSGTGAFANGASTNYLQFTSAGTKSVVFIADSTAVQFKRLTVCDFTIDNTSVREVIPVANCKGLLIEEQRTNLLLHSRDMTQAAWSKTDVTASRTMVGLDGVANSACLMTEGSAGNAISYQQVAATGATTHAASLVVKRGNTDFLFVQFGNSTTTNYVRTWVNLSTGVVSNTTQAGTVTSVNVPQPINLGGGWYRVTIVAALDAADTLGRLAFFSAASAGSTTRVSGATYIIDCAQLEVGAFTTSIIPTTTATVTRSADVCSMTGTNFSSWWNGTAGTFVVEFDTFSPGDVGVAGSGSSARYFNAQSTPVRNWDGATMVQATGSPQIHTLPVVKAATAFVANTERAICQNGGGVFTGTCAAAFTAGTQLWIGDYNGAWKLNGHIRTLKFYPKRLPNETLRALTL